MENSFINALPQFEKVSFYIIAHADDWQLFMHPNVYNDIVDPRCKVIFIITTAGDAAIGEKYWTAREEGSKSSVRFCFANRQLPELGGNRQLNGHPVHFWSFNNTTTYFFRLPDGNLDGNGFLANSFQSLTGLRLGKLNSITTVNNDTTYNSWVEFVNTIESIIALESQGISNGWMHYLNPDLTRNPGDHPDHIATGIAIQSMPVIKNFHQLLFVGYSFGSLSGKLSANELFWKAGMFAVYENAVYGLCGYSTLQENVELYLKWCRSKAEFFTIECSSFF
ncbi:MAG: hypothetical protein ABIN94_00985 [Ferruginibacter sp.]